MSRHIFPKLFQLKRGTMSWFESLSKEEFQAIIREALKEDFDVIAHELKESIKLLQDLIRVPGMATEEARYHKTVYKSRKKVKRTVV
jgi:hypothetical protein